MLNLESKIEILKAYLLDIKDSYTDSFKTDILFYFDKCEIFEENKNLFKFLSNLNSKEEILNSIDSLSSKIAMKFNEDEEQLSDFIFYEINK